MGPEPWALSPLVSTMPHIVHTSLESGISPPAFPSRTESIGDDVSSLIELSPSSSSSSSSSSLSSLTRPLTVKSDADSDKSSSSGSSSSFSLPKRRSNSNSKSVTGDAKKRRAYFSSASARRNVMLGPQDMLTTDFCYGFLAFPQLALTLPGGLAFDLTRYWDGQPVRFVCCLRPKTEDGETVGEARVFWCVAIESVDD